MPIDALHAGPIPEITPGLASAQSGGLSADQAAEYLRGMTDQKR